MSQFLLSNKTVIFVRIEEIIFFFVAQGNIRHIRNWYTGVNWLIYYECLKD